MTTAELRTVALALQQRILAMEAGITPAYNEAASWVLDEVDANLPTISEVKAVLEAYEAFEKPSLLLYEEVRAIKTDSDPAVELPVALPGVADWLTMLNKPATFPPDEHTHEGMGGGSAAWADITDKPLTFPADAQLPSIIKISGVWLRQSETSGVPLDYSFDEGQSWQNVFPPAAHTHFYSEIMSDPE